MNLKSASYLAIMLVSGTIYSFFKTNDIFVAIAGSVFLTIFAYMYALLSNGLKALWRKFISKKVLIKEMNLLKSKTWLNAHHLLIWLYLQQQYISNASKQKAHLSQRCAFYIYDMVFIPSL